MMKGNPLEKKQNLGVKIYSHLQKRKNTTAEDCRSKYSDISPDLVAQCRPPETGQIFEIIKVWEYLKTVLCHMS